MPSKLLKMALLTILLLAAGFGFGIICRRMGFAHQLFVAPFRELLRLMLWLLLSLILVAVVAGMVAVLFRPQWLAFVAFGLSGVALLFGWGLTLRNIALSSLYVLAGVVYTVLTKRDLRQRISFSVRPVAGNWRFVTVVLLLLAVASFYFDFSEDVRDKGVSIPEKQVDDLTTDIAVDVVDGMPLSSLQALRQEGVKQVQRVLKEQLRSLVSKVEPYIPPMVAVLLFLLLFAVTWLLWWVPMLALSVLFAMLIWLRVAEMATETVEVQRWVLR